MLKHSLSLRIYAVKYTLGIPLSQAYNLGIFVKKRILKNHPQSRHTLKMQLYSELRSNNHKHDDDLK